MERDAHYRLIKQIERFPELYNYNLPDYANKLKSDKLWAEVAKKTNSTVGECKEKWRNIRSSFIRSRKAPPNGSRPKKTYYLAEHLTFVLPFIKSRDNASYREDEEHENIIESDTQSQDFNYEVEKSDQDDDFELTNKEDEVYFTEPPNSSYHTLRNVKRRLSEDDTITYPKRKENPKVAKYTHPMQYFFLSLLDEFDTMDEHQIRQFKIRVLQIIDEIKTNKVTQPFGVSASPEPSHITFQSSPASTTSQNLLVYSTKRPKENLRTQSLDPSSSKSSVEANKKDTIEVNIEDSEFEGDTVVKLENDVTDYD